MIEKRSATIAKSDTILQKDSSYVIKNDGTIEASLTFSLGKDYLDELPAIDEDHPVDRRLKCYNKNITYGDLDIITCTCSYFGIAAKQSTDPVFDYSGGTSSEPIETHDRFDVFAGTNSAPLNGATYDSETGAFVNFSGEEAGDFLGVQYYLTPAVNVTVNYWTTNKPDLTKRMKVHTVPEIGKDTFREVPGVADYLLVDMPYRRVGDLYQVSELYMGSGARGWNKTIYKAAAK